jgi:hypothetical protein
MGTGTLWDKVKTVPCCGKKAGKYAQEYQDELNNDLDMGGCIKVGKDFISVCAIPWSQAREYSTDKIIKAIEEASEYKPKEKKK